MESPLRGSGGVPGLQLIETLAWDGAAFVRQTRHLARLARSAALLGWRPDADAAQAALRSAVGAAAARVRLTLDSQGTLGVQLGPLPAPAAIWRLGVAPERLQSNDPWLRVKSTRRGPYDRARASMPADLDEVVLLNERGEVCDGSITTLFFDAGAGLCTPPLRCGLLPGVLREELLEAGHCAEAVLRAEDLGRARLWVGNSLRGLIPALWVRQPA